MHPIDIVRSQRQVHTLTRDQVLYGASWDRSVMAPEHITKGTLIPKRKGKMTWATPQGLEPSPYQVSWVDVVFGNAFLATVVS